MPILNIKDMKVVSPSPDNFILDLEISSIVDPIGHRYNYIASGEHIYQNDDGSIDTKLLDKHVAHSSIIKNTIATGLYVINDSGLFYFSFESETFTKIDNFDEDSVIGEIRENNGILYLMVSEKYDEDSSKRIIQFYKLLDNNNIIKLGRLPYLFDASYSLKQGAPLPATVDSNFGFSIASDELMYATYGTAKNVILDSREYGTNIPGVFRSKDGGKTWELLQDSPKSWKKIGSQGRWQDGYQCVFALKNTNTVFTRGLDYFYKSIDCGETWTEFFDQNNDIDLYTKDGKTFYCTCGPSYNRKIQKIVVTETNIIRENYCNIPHIGSGVSDNKIFMINENEFYINCCDVICHTKDRGQSWDYIYTNNIIERTYNPNNPIYDHCEEVHSLYFMDKSKLLPVFALFDMNDIGITTDDNDVIDNLLLTPNSNLEPSQRKMSIIPMHTINANSVYGYLKPIDNKSFPYPEYDETNSEFTIACNEPDSLTFYKKRNVVTNISNVLGLGNQAELSAYAFDKMFVFDPTDDNRLAFANSIQQWRNYQSNTSYKNYRVTNNFDNGTLLARTILIPKQTLNNEYSTERQYLPSDISSEQKQPFHYARKYKWDDSYFYSNGMDIVINYKEQNKFDINPLNNAAPGTMVTSTYSNRFGNIIPKEHKIPELKNTLELISRNGTSYKPKTDYNLYETIELSSTTTNTDKGIFNQYMPELIKRENETVSEAALIISRHKANIFDIQFVDLWKSIGKKFDSIRDLNNANSSEISAFNEIKSNLKQSIKNNLYKLVEEIKPIHTKLYKIEMDN